MKNLSKTLLGNLVEFQRGYDLPKDQLIKGIYPVISSNGIFGYHNESKVKAPGVTIGRSGTVGYPQFIEEDFFPHNTALFVKDFKGNNEKYIYYLLKYLKLNDRKTGTGVPTMNRNDLHPLEIKAHLDKSTQQQIAHILSTLDAKIALNNLINKELEAMAKTIYDYWFVQFEFPNEDGKPYKSSGGKMVWNEDLKREVPEGWEVKELSELTILNHTPCNEDEYLNLDIIDLSSMPSNSIALNDKSPAGSFKTNLFKMKKMDILFGSIRPYLNKAGIASFDGAVNGTIHSYLPKNKIDYSFLVCSLINKYTFKYAFVHSKGTKMPVIESKELLRLLVPYSTVMSLNFNNIVYKYWELIVSNIIQTRSLISVRDFLLPLLMNGQVTVQ
ncbi:MAG: restriction endonuclease subunit S [Limnohabitans sp.]|nr:restriction endonuclease subunit S [Limnohabitans sp.]